MSTNYENNYTDDTSKINTITMNLEKLTLQYNNLLTSYKQALADYIDYVNEIVLDGIALAIVTALKHLND